MNLGDEIRVLVRDVDQNGDGVGVDVARDGEGPRVAAADPKLEWHVPGALPGEEVTVRIDALSAHRRVGWGTLRQLHRPSPDRTSPACAAYGLCGGCVLQHWRTSSQLAWKDSWLRGRIGAEPLLASTPLLPMVASPLSLGYRNNAKLVAARDESGRLVLGAYARRSHDVVDLEGCQITEAPIQLVADGLRDLLRQVQVDPYDEVRLTGLLRYVVLRANASGQVLVTLVTATENFPAGQQIASALQSSHPNVVGVVNNVNSVRGNAIYGTHQRTLAGHAVIEDRIGDVRLRVSSRAFFQANRQVAQAVYAAIKESVALSGSERVLDAYAGVGGIALTLAPQARTVLGLEEHAQAVEDAQASAALNGIQNASFIAGDVAAHLSEIRAVDVAVLNPPRKGCGDAVLRQVAQLHPRTIAYLSCAPETLLRDLKTLVSLRYRPTKIIAFDMLPHTPHIESLAILARE